MIILKNNGTTEKYNRDKLLKYLRYLINNDSLIKMIIDNVESKLYNNIKSIELYNLILGSISPLISLYPELDNAAAQILNQVKKKRINSNLKKDYQYIKFKDFYNKNKEFLKDVDNNLLDFIDSIIEPTRDKNIPYIGISAIYDKYLFEGEFPQLGFARVALNAFIDEYFINKFRPYRQNIEDYDNEIKKDIKEHYDNLSNAIYIEASPKWFAGLLKKNSAASCCILIPQDDLKDILNVMSDSGMLSKYGGGLAWYYGFVRADKDKIAFNGQTKGILPYAQLAESIVNSASQMGKRKGAGIIYYDTYGKDIETFLMLNDKGGSNENRARGLKLGVVVNKEFMNRVRENKDYSLFSPKDVALNEIKEHDKFKEKYEEYEKSTIDRITVSARELFEKAVVQRKKTGNIYVMFKENANGDTSPFYDTIYTSNLCVAPETKILTKEGYKPIVELAGKNVDIWNGEEWSNVKVVKTGTNQKIIKVKTTVGELECTPYHKFYLKDGREVRAYELKVGDKLIEFKEPTGEHKADIKVLAIEDNGRYDDTYCFTEPKRHMGMFNGILTSQCNETFLPHNFEKDIYTQLCNLAAINLSKFIALDKSQRERAAYLLLKAQDNIIEHGFYPTKNGEYVNKRYRPLLIGVVNYAHYLALNNYKYTDKESLDFIDKTYKEIQRCFIIGSARLAKERGKFEGFYETKWSDDEWVDFFVKDREAATMAKTYGVRFSTHLGQAPNATSSLVANATEGIEPIRDYIYKKQTQEGDILVSAPDLRELRSKYQLQKEIDNFTLIDHAAVRQKYLEQGQSVNTYVNDIEGNEVYSTLYEFKLWEYAIEKGLKGLYYFNGEKNDECFSCAN